MSGIKAMHLEQGCHSGVDSPIENRQFVIIPVLGLVWENWKSAGIWENYFARCCMSIQITKRPL